MPQVINTYFDTCKSDTRQTSLFTKKVQGDNEVR